MQIMIGKGLVLPASMRAELAMPIGMVVKDSGLAKALPRDAEIYAVGDKTVMTLLKYGYKPKVIIYDRLIQRRKVRNQKAYENFKGVKKVTNKAGMITPELWNTISGAAESKENTIIEVVGEDDMASLACIHFAKMGAFCIYGIPKEGMTVIHITRLIKEIVDDMIGRLGKVTS